MLNHAKNGLTIFKKSLGKRTDSSAGQQIENAKF